MYKMIIADDENIIRRGLKNALDWQSLDVHIIGEAEDGEMAYNLCTKLKPDIVLVDICMPFLSGLELIEKINSESPETYMIIISGHDEFEYAQKAVKLKVADYILKPVDEEELARVITKVIGQMEVSNNLDNFHKIRNRAFDKNYDQIKDKYMEEYLSGRIRYNAEEFEFYNEQFENKIGMLIIRPINHVNIYEKNYVFDNELLGFSVHNIVSELAESFKSKIVFRIKEQFIIALIDVEDYSACEMLSAEIEHQLMELLHRECYIKYQIVEDIIELPEVYNQIIMRIESDFEYTPVVFRAKRYIEQHFEDPELSLIEVANHVRMNPTYLSRFLKYEVGHSFVE
ncbi:MAG: response regulator [Vallitaleaceae bacterium]|jgi:two-component system response regulator YesN|nr:response regulator [Vallitaleaceae bacterium]